MIGSLSGVVQEIDIDPDASVQLVVDVGGVGYLVAVTPRLASTVSAVGAAISLSIYTHVREGAITLFGFASTSERRSFQLLLSAHGVGPSLALAIVSAFSPSALSNAIVNADVDALVTVPGVGRKTAQRLIVDLASRVDAAPISAHVSPGEDDQQRIRSDARAALGALGYGTAEIRHALEQLDDEVSVEALIRSALRELAPRS